MKPFTALLLVCYISVGRAENLDDRAKLLSAATRDIEAQQFESARQLLQQGIRHFPRDADLWNLLGIADTELHKMADAKSAFLHGLDLAPDSISLNENIGLLFYRQADYVATKRYLQHAMELGDKQPGVLFSFAASQLRTGERAQALTTFKQLEPALGNVPGYWGERGRAELFFDASAAETSFARALQLAPNDVAALNGAATAAERQGMDEKALAFLIQARTANPNDVETLGHFGAVCIRRDLGPDAVEALEKAHQLDPQDDSLLFLLARANISVQNWQRAYDLLADYSNRRPRIAPAFYAMGWVAVRLDRMEDARHRLEHALLLDPGMIDARYELAQLDLNQGELDSAAKLLDEVLKQQPDHAKANMALGQILLRRGDLEGARTHLQNAIDHDGTLASAHYQLATVLFRQGEREKAQAERTLAAQLEAEAKRASRTQLKLVLPDAEPGANGAIPH